MEIGLRQAVIRGFENKFPLTSELLKRNLETVYANEFRESDSKPEEYKFELSVEYYREDEDGSPLGEAVTAPDGSKLCETRTVLIIGHYPGQFGRIKTALSGLNLVDPKSGVPIKETQALETLCTQIKSYPLDSIPREI